ncbi:MAG: hypothetical protein ACLQIQ_13210 [Beijerinckiaceae bacterium]
MKMMIVPLVVSALSAAVVVASAEQKSTPVSKQSDCVPCNDHGSGYRQEFCKAHPRVKREDAESMYPTPCP